MHGGISISNFTAGRRRENNSVAFGKAAVGNELLGNAFFPGLMPSAVTKRQAGSETCVSGYTQASLSRPARLASLAMRQGRRLHDGEVLQTLLSLLFNNSSVDKLVEPGIYGEIILSLSPLSPNKANIYIVLSLNTAYCCNWCHE